MAEVPVVLACQDNVFVAVPQSLLIKESTVFLAELSNTWQNKEDGPLAKKRKRVSKTAVNGNSTEVTTEEEKSEHSGIEIYVPNTYLLINTLLSILDRYHRIFCNLNFSLPYTIGRGIFNFLIYPS